MPISVICRISPADGRIEDLELVLELLGYPAKLFREGGRICLAWNDDAVLVLEGPAALECRYWGLLLRLVLQHGLYSIGVELADLEQIHCIPPSERLLMLREDAHILLPLLSRQRC